VAFAARHLSALHPKFKVQQEESHTIGCHLGYTRFVDLADAEAENGVKVVLFCFLHHGILRSHAVSDSLCKNKQNASDGTSSVP
tara:strand:- start:98 stop:349 length:252 start_codon:yes stop_codon:yes gene_type:complete